LFKLEKSRVYFFDDFIELDNFISSVDKEKYYICKTLGKDYFKKRRYDKDDGDDINNYKDDLCIEIKLKEKYDDIFCFNKTYLLLFNKDDYKMLDEVFEKLE